jgi:hypothetical protein
MRKLATLVAPLLVLVGLVAFSSVAYADTRIFTGNVMNPDSTNGTFWLVTDHSGTLQVFTNQSQPITDKDGSARHFSDLVDGLKVKVTGDFQRFDMSLINLDRISIRSY